MLQHFAAGIIFATICTEIVPEMLNRSYIDTMIVGYIAGIILIYAIIGVDKAINSGDSKGWTGVALAGVPTRYICRVGNNGLFVIWKFCYGLYV